MLKIIQEKRKRIDKLCKIRRIDVHSVWWVITHSANHCSTTFSTPRLHLLLSLYLASPHLSALSPSPHTNTWMNENYQNLRFSEKSETRELEKNKRYANNRGDIMPIEKNYFNTKVSNWELMFYFFLDFSKENFIQQKTRRNYKREIYEKCPEMMRPCQSQR